MPIAARIVADSLNPANNRIVTWELTYNRGIHSEVMTHRESARNAASSRAIPVETIIRQVEEDPFIPQHWGAAQKGMQASAELEGLPREASIALWLELRDQAVRTARALLACGNHKQNVNRLLEPWMWMKTILTATTHENFFLLRDHSAAEPHFQTLARGMHTAFRESKPEHLEPEEWHLPYVPAEDRALCAAEGRHPREISVVRCARVSYYRPGEAKPDIREEWAKHDEMKTQRPLHASPFEHPCMALGSSARIGPFEGWLQYRKLLPNEDGRAPRGIA